MSYPDVDAMLADAAPASPAAGADEGQARPAGSVARGDRLPRRDAATRADQRGAKLEVWSGDRWDDTLRALADEHGLKGPAQRLLAALDSVTGS